MSTVVVTSSGSGQATCLPGNQLVNQVGRIVGGEGEANIRLASLDCINRVRMRLQRRDWRFLKTTASAITLVDGTSTYSLPTAFKSPSYAVLLDSDSKPDYTLRYVDDAWYAHVKQNQESGGRPWWYKLLNAYGDGKITIYPTPDVSAAADWTLSVEYFKRFPPILDTAVAIDLPEEVSDVFVLGGQAFMLRERDKRNDDTEKAMWRDYTVALGELVAYDRRISDEHPRFRIGSAVEQLGTVYIKV